jgi:hypothetical protein
LAHVRAYINTLSSRDEVSVAWRPASYLPDRSEAVQTYPAEVLSPDPSIANKDELLLSVRPPGVIGGFCVALSVADGVSIPVSHFGRAEVLGRYMLVVPESFEVPSPTLMIDDEGIETFNIETGAQHVEVNGRPAIVLTPGELALRDVVNALRRIGRDQLPEPLYTNAMRIAVDAQRLLGRAIAERLVPIAQTPLSDPTPGPARPPQD